MVKINLLPDVVLERRRQARIRRMANLGIIAWAVVVLVVLLGAFTYSQVQSARLSAAEEERDELDAEVNSPENVAFREEALSVQASLDTLAGLFETRRSAVVFWDTLGTYTPEDVRIDEVNLDSEGALVISGFADSFEDVSAFEQALKESRSDYQEQDLEQEEGIMTELEAEKTGYFGDIQLNGTGIAGDSSVTFDLHATYYPPLASEDTGQEEVLEDDFDDEETETEVDDG